MNHQNLPLISIVLCTYNGELFLREQLDSLLAQTYPNLEIIISDDASTDGTIDILKTYATNKAIRLYLNEENKGYIQNFSFALGHANGAYISLCDQDDIWLPHKIETLHTCFGDELLVYSDSLLINDKGISIGKKLSDIRAMYSGKDTKSFFLYNVVWGHALMIRRELLADALPIPDAIPHDIWLAYKAATISGIKYCDAVLTRYRQHAGAFTQTLLPKHINRSRNKRFEDYQVKLYWLSVMQEHAADDEAEFYKEFLALYKRKEERKYNYALFFFMLKHQHELYRFSKKNFISRLIDIRKWARSEFAE
jgi:glycosyltransferase involved in cell wall biosynthesis